jgi:hypothetical protein
MKSSNRLTTLVVIDSAVNDYQSLVNGINADAEVIVLDPSQDGVEQITQTLAGRNEVKSIHILSHGGPGTIQLGSTHLSWKTLSDYAAQIQSWAKAFTVKTDILLYGCEVAAGKLGRSFVQQLSRLTGVDIAASTNLTGSAALGGDWELEFATGHIETPLAFQPEAMQAYGSVLVQFLDETFTGTDVVDNTAWLFGIGAGTTSANPFLTARPTVAPSAPSGLPGNPGTPDAPGQGALRLTSNANNQATFVLYNQPIDATAGLKVTFDLFSYGGTTSNPGLPAGADGVSFFFVNGNASPTTAGAFGGSLGYAQKASDGIPGIVGGYLGVGLDEFGNFSNPLDVPDGGVQRTGGPGRVPDSVSIRGSEQTGYLFTTGTGSLPFGIDNVAPGASRENSKRTVSVDLSQTGLLTVRIDGNNDGDFLDPGEVVISNYNIADMNGAPPPTLKIGFASGTGDSTNFHEIRNLDIRTRGVDPVAADVSGALPPSSVLNVVGLSATDADGTIASFNILTLPSADQGVLYLGNPAAGGTPIAAGQSLTPDQITQVFYQSSGSFTGANFTYTATDNDGNVDETPATVTLTPLGNNLPPQAANITATLPQNTAVNLPPLSATDSDGTIQSYTVLTLPPAAEGVLYLGNPANNNSKPITAGQTLTQAQISQIYFKSSNTFDGSSFTYTATDNRGATDPSPATVTLNANTPVSPAGCLPGRTRIGNSKPNKLKGGKNLDTLIGRGGNDILRGKGCNDVLQGNRGKDTLNGGDARDKLLGQQGNDLLKGAKGDDVLYGGFGKDRGNGGKGKDVIFGNKGNDRLNGNGGEDRVIAGRGKDKVNGGTNNDFLNGQQGDDTVKGGKGSDFLNGGLGKDKLNGNQKRDTIYGGHANDVLRGKGAPDSLYGGQGNDRLVGGTQPDRLIGNGGRDAILGKRGADTMTGGIGRDRFVYTSAEEGFDLITDFKVTRDRIDLSQIFTKTGYDSSNPLGAYVKIGGGSNAVIRVDANGDTAGGFERLVRLNGVAAGSLSNSNFIV